MTTRTLPAVVASLLALAGPAAGDDWPQWRGPNRDDVSKETGLLKSWPKDGPKLLWTYDNTGIGYSGPAVVGDRFYIMGARGDSEYLIALGIKNNMVKEAWATKIGPVYENPYGSGPRGTPTVEGDRVYAIGGRGDLVCVEAAAGKMVWQTSLQTDLGGQIPNWGYAESPLIDGDQLVCTPGGNKGTLAALDKRTGEVIWRSKKLTDAAAYSSIVAADVNGVRQYIQMTRQGQAGVAAKDGRLLWQQNQAVNRVAVIPTPIFHDNCVYVTSGYSAGCALLRLVPDGEVEKAEKVYNNKNMVNHHGGVVRLNEHLYGYSDGKGWVCQDFKTGKNIWEERRKLGKGSLTYADGRLYCYTEHDGTVALIEASPEGWKEHARFTIPAPKMPKPHVNRPDNVWTHPVVANGRLYLRDQYYIYCYDIQAR